MTYITAKTIGHRCPECWKADRPCERCHAAKKRNQTRRWVRRVASGVRLDCTAPTEPGKLRCAEHLSQANESSKASHARARAQNRQGRCDVCRGKAHPCAACLSKRASRQRLDTLRKQAEGICRDCTASAVIGRAHCQTHIESRRRNERLRRERAGT